MDLLIKNARICTEDGVIEGSIAVKDGKIAEFGEISEKTASVVVDAKGDYILPGGVDAHVHARYPSHPERGDFYTETQAAAAGGVTTFVEHPIALPPQYSTEILMERVAGAEKDAIVDFAFLGAAGGEKAEFIEELGKSGIVGYKTFLHAAPEGRDQEFVGLTAKDNYELLKVFREVKKTGLPMSAHAEDNDIISGMIKEFRAAGKTHGKDHAHSRPLISEVLAVERLLRFGKDTEVPLYLVHISVPEAVRLAKEARDQGQTVYIETCPHYLFLTEDRLDEIGSFAKCNPPLRTQTEIDGMWEWIQNGTIDTVCSDHGPFTVAEKQKNPDDIFTAPAGFIGVDLRLPLMNTAVKQGKITLERMVELISTNPAKIFGLYPQKGAIRVGADADLVLIDLDEKYTIDHNDSFSHSKDIGLAFEGMEVYGKVKQTYVRGQLVFDTPEITANRGYGMWIKKEIS